MRTPLVLDASSRFAAAAPAVRLSGPAWEALLVALSRDPAERSLPGTATVLAQAPGEALQIEYAGRVASLPGHQQLAAGTALRLVFTPATQLPSAGAGARNEARLSAAGQTLARLADASAREPPPATALRVDSAAGQASPQQVAAALADAIAGSGVFLESHLAQWVQGSRSAASAIAEARARAAAETGAGDTPLRQQIACLVSGEAAFRFSAWPEQDVTLTISGEPEADPQSGAPGRRFFAQLEMELAELGSVRALLSLDLHGIDIDLRASAPASARVLEENRGALARAFAAAGLRAARIEVGNEP